MSAIEALPVPLSYLLQDRKGEEPITPFDATLHTIPITVTAVLEKTVIYEIGTDPWPKREQAKPSDVLVDPLALRWRAVKPEATGPRQWRRLPGKDPRSDEEKAEGVERSEKLVAESKRSAEARLAADLAADKRRVEAAAAERRAAEPAPFTPPMLTVVPDPESTVELLIPWPHINPDLIKRCPKCTFIKTRDAFAKNRGRPDGLQVTCRECMSAYWKTSLTPDQVKTAASRLVADYHRQAAEAALARLVIPWPGLDPDQVKQCKNCDFIKPRTSFSTHPRTADGRQAWCRLCMAESIRAGKTRELTEVAARLPDRKAEAAPAAVQKYCPKCESLKDLEDFALNRSKPDGHQAYCRDCMRRANIDWGSRHKPTVTAAEVVLDQLENMLEGVGGLRSEMQSKDRRIQDLEAEVARLLQTINLITHLEELTGRMERALTQPARGPAVRIPPGANTAVQVKATLQRLGFSAGEARSALDTVEWTPETTAASALRTALKALAPN